MKSPRFTIHPVAQMFPLVEGEAFEVFCADIKAHGQREPIVVVKGPKGEQGGLQIIDGRNRYRACQKLGIKPKWTVWNGQGSLGELAASLNFFRRHLSPSQKAAAAVAIEEQFAVEAESARLANLKKGSKNPEPEKIPARGDSRDRAAKLCGVNPRYISDAKLVRLQSPQIFDQLVCGSLTIQQARRAVHREHKRRCQIAATNLLPSLDPGACRIETADCLKFLETLPAKSARLIFTDPPYNLGFDYGNGSKADQLPEPLYYEWCQRWMEECKRVLASDGSILVMIDGKHAADFGVMLSSIPLDLRYRNLIIWHEKFGCYTDDNFTPCARFIHYYTKDARGGRFVFDGDAIRIPSDRQAKYGDKRANPAGKVPGNVWEFPRLVDNARERMPGFPTQVPQTLVERIVLACSEPGDLVVDPFVGSGTTPAAAIKYGRQFAGCDHLAKNVKAASERVARQIAALGKGAA